MVDHPSAGLLDQSYVEGLRELGNEEFNKLVRLFLKDGQARVDGLRERRLPVTRLRWSSSHTASKGARAALEPEKTGGALWRAPSPRTRSRRREDARMIDCVDAEFVLASAALREELRRG